MISKCHSEFDSEFLKFKNRSGINFRMTIIDMISKENRLREKQVKKVLRKGKPFFSYGIVLNYLRNKKDFNRFAIVIGSKSVNTNITRNFFRRRFYNFVSKYIFINRNIKINYDFVFVIKKQTKLDKSNKKTIISFEKDLGFLIKKIRNIGKSV